MIGFLRLLGILNGAIWFGSAIFFSLAVQPALGSEPMRDLLGAANHPYFSQAIAHLLMKRYFWLQIACGLVALLQGFGERLYLGRAPGKLWSSLCIVLIVLGVFAAVILRPKMENANSVRYSVQAKPQQRQVANEAFNFWKGIFQITNLLVVGGSGIYLWRMANPGESTRFVGTGKFRS